MKTLTGEQIYRNLQLHLDNFPIGFPATESGVEIEILKFFFTPLEAMIGYCIPAFLHGFDDHSGSN